MCWVTEQTFQVIFIPFYQRQRYTHWPNSWHRAKKPRCFSWLQTNLTWSLGIEMSRNWRHLQSHEHVDNFQTRVIYIKCLTHTQLTVIIFSNFHSLTLLKKQLSDIYYIEPNIIITSLTHYLGDELFPSMSTPYTSIASWLDDVKQIPHTVHFTCLRKITNSAHLYFIQLKENSTPYILKTLRGKVTVQAHWTSSHCLVYSVFYQRNEAYPLIQWIRQTYVSTAYLEATPAKICYFPFWLCYAFYIFHKTVFKYAVIFLKCI